MYGKAIVSLALLALLACSAYSGSISVADGAYEAEWQVVGEELIVVIVAKTQGYIGFGFSADGSMRGADLFISGANADGTTYGTDYHGVNNTAPVVDAQQDYTLIVAQEDVNGTITHFKRPLISTDKTEDLDVTNAEVYLLYSWGQTDDIAYHGANRGAALINPYDP